VVQQGPPPSGSGRPPAASRRGDSRATGRSPWDDPADTGEEYPPWAGPAVGPRWAGQEARQRGRHGEDSEPAPGDSARSGASDGDEAGGWNGAPRPGFRSRMAAARSRRRSQVMWVWGGAAVAVAGIVAGLLFALGGSPAGTTSTGGFVTTFQPGEFRVVPSACASVTPATLGQYLPGHRRVIAPHSLDGSAQSLCNWTLDAPPLYRVLEVTVQAYAPSGLASGSGSATFAATDAYQQALQAKRHPARATHLPPATVTGVPGLGSAAFAALQVVLARGDATDLETVVARDRNVLVTVVLQGPHRHTGRYGPVSPLQLRAGAVAAAQDILSRL
jgi:hypothetical protein